MREELSSRSRRDCDSGGIEHASARRDTCAVDVVARVGAVVVPDDEVIRAVERNARALLGEVGRRNCNPGRIENRPVASDPRAVDVIGRATAVLLPRHERAVATRPDGRIALVVTGRRDRDPLRIEHDPASSHSGSVDVTVIVAPKVSPGEQVVRTVEPDAGLVLLPHSSRDGDSSRVEHPSSLAHASRVDVRGDPSQRWSSHVTRNSSPPNATAGVNWSPGAVEMGMPPGSSTDPAWVTRAP